jgi:hypothetical protein
MAQLYFSSRPVRQAVAALSSLGNGNNKPLRQAMPVCR